MYTNIYIDEPIERIAGDWDFLNDKIVQKLQGFTPIGDNIYGILIDPRVARHQARKRR